MTQLVDDRILDVGSLGFPARLEAEAFVDLDVGVLQRHAPAQDLEGDIDAFAIRAALMYTPCGDSGLEPLVMDRPLFDVLRDYYLVPTSTLGQAREECDRCFLELLGIW